MDKKFSELKEGDEFYVWRYDTLYKYTVKRAYPIAGEDIGIILDDDRCYTVIYPNESAMIWGTDGWNEYTILGTSKGAVRALLEEVLLEDAQKLAAITQKWLAEFDK